MSLRIIRNDLTLMDVDAIVNTANPNPAVGAGCDTAVYKAAGYDELLALRREIGSVPEGEAFITPGLNLKARYIIHAVSPCYGDGKSGEEEKLRSCYRRSLEIARENGLKTIAFPLISAGSYGYPRNEAMRVALDEINGFLLECSMDVFMVLFEKESVGIADGITSDLKSYIDDHYVSNAVFHEYSSAPISGSYTGVFEAAANFRGRSLQSRGYRNRPLNEADEPAEDVAPGLEDRLKHLSDTFSEYLLYLIEQNGRTNAECYKDALVDKKVFSKIKNNRHYHPTKITAMCLCVGSHLNIDQTRDLLARAGYALSPCDKTDIIFQYFIEHEFYDMIDLDIALEDNGEKPLIS